MGVSTKATVIGHRSEADRRGLLGGIYLRLLITREPLDDEFLVGLADFLTARGAGR